MATGDDERRKPSLHELADAATKARADLGQAGTALCDLQAQNVRLNTDITNANEAQHAAKLHEQKARQELYAALNAELARGTVTVGEVAALLGCDKEKQARLTELYFTATERLRVGEGYVLRDEDDLPVWGTLEGLVPEIHETGNGTGPTLDMLTHLRPPAEHDDGEEAELVEVRVQAAHMGYDIMTADDLEEQISVNPSVLDRFNGSYLLSSERINNMGRMLGALRWSCGDVDRANDFLQEISAEVRRAVELDYKDGKWAIKRCSLPTDGRDELQAALAVLKEYVPDAYAELERNVKILMATTDFSAEENDPNGFVMVTEPDLLGFAQAATGLKRYEAAALFEAEGQELRAELEAEAANN